MKKILFILFFICIYIKANAQVNLVPNPSFEAFMAGDTFCNCGIIWATPPWITPTGGSPECFKTCAIYQPQSLVPQNIWGFQWPRTGIGYAGFGVYVDPLLHPDDREYIQVQLTDTLKNNRKYNVNFYVNLSDTSWYAIDAIGAYISDTAIHKNITDRSPFSSFIPQIKNQNGNILTDKINWTLISGIYEAHGGEKYITIGNFYNDANTDTLKVSYGGSFPAYLMFSYYYIDDVSVTLIPDTIPTDTTTTDDIFIPNIFSPNNDGNNDVLYVRSHNIKTMDFCIYNRWGEKVFETKDINKGWDGTYKNSKCNEGVFVYYLSCTLKDDKTIEKKGNVTLVR